MNQEYRVAHDRESWLCYFVTGIRQVRDIFKVFRTLPYLYPSLVSGRLGAFCCRSRSARGAPRALSTFTVQQYISTTTSSFVRSLFSFDPLLSLIFLLSQCPDVIISPPERLYSQLCLL